MIEEILCIGAYFALYIDKLVLKWLQHNCLMRGGSLRLLLLQISKIFAAICQIRLQSRLVSLHGNPYFRLTFRRTFLVNNLYLLGLRVLWHHELSGSVLNVIIYLRLSQILLNILNRLVI